MNSIIAHQNSNQHLSCFAVDLVVYISCAEFRTRAEVRAGLGGLEVFIDGMRSTAAVLALTAGGDEQFTVSSRPLTLLLELASILSCG